MKLKKIPEGYNVLLNDNNMHVYCIKRTPATTLVPDNLGRPQIAQFDTPINFCGDHCPFFNLKKPLNGNFENTMEVYVNCQHEQAFYRVEIAKDEAKKINLNP